MRYDPAVKALSVVMLSVAFQLSLHGAGKQVAITIDDLPYAGDNGPTTLAEARARTERLLHPFGEQGIPVIGFVNEGRHTELGSDGLRQILELWLENGADLGNHSYSHLNINQVSLDDYTADIVTGEPMLRAVLSEHGKALRYYRHPFLFLGPTPDVKRGLQAFLDQHQYRVAPVTFANDDYEYANLYANPKYRERVLAENVPYIESVVAFFEQRSLEVVGREFPQILLVHASQLNADVMPDLLAMFRRRGYTFITLDRALADEAYSLPEEYVGKGGFSWIHRWSKTKGMAPKGEPEVPQWVRDASKAP